MSENQMLDINSLSNEKLDTIMNLIIKKKLEVYEDKLIEIADDAVKLNVKVDNLENKMTIDYSQQEELRIAANKSAIRALGGCDTTAYKELAKKVFSSIWRDYKRVMNVNSYKNTAVVNYENALNYIRNWTPGRELELMIMGANSLNNGGGNNGI